ncbi:MAG: tetratricopeptide repeat protein [Candidatus Anstonellales archaeon]
MRKLLIMGGILAAAPALGESEHVTRYRSVERLYTLRQNLPDSLVPLVDSIIAAVYYDSTVNSSRIYVYVYRYNEVAVNYGGPYLAADGFNVTILGHSGGTGGGGTQTEWEIKPGEGEAGSKGSEKRDGQKQNQQTAPQVNETQRPLLPIGERPIILVSEWAKKMGITTVGEFLDSAYIPLFDRVEKGPFGEETKKDTAVRKAILSWMQEEVKKDTVSEYDIAIYIGRAYHNAGINYESQGEYELALKFLEKSEKYGNKEKDNIKRIREKLAEEYYRKGKKAEEEGNHEEAEKNYKRAGEYGNKNVEKDLKRIENLKIPVGERPVKGTGKTVKEYLKEKISLENEINDIINRIGSRNTDEEGCEESIVITAATTYYHEKGTQALESGEYEEALRCFQNAEKFGANEEENIELAEAGPGWKALKKLKLYYPKSYSRLNGITEISKKKEVLEELSEYFDVMGRYGIEPTEEDVLTVINANMEGRKQK